MRSRVEIAPGAYRVPGSKANGITVCRDVAVSYRFRAAAAAAAQRLIDGAAQWLGGSYEILIAQCDGCGWWHLILGRRSPNMETDRE